MSRKSLAERRRRAQTTALVEELRLELLEAGLPLRSLRTTQDTLTQALAFVRALNGRRPGPHPWHASSTEVSPRY